MTTTRRPTRQLVLNYIRTFYVREQHSPSIEEIRQACGISSKSVVAYHIDFLRAAGLITYANRKTRTIVPTTLPRSLVSDD